MYLPLHNVPLKPSRHWQMKFGPSIIQVPPFKHGPDEHCVTIENYGIYLACRRSYEQLQINEIYFVF